MPEDSVTSDVRQHPTSTRIAVPRSESASPSAVAMGTGASVPAAEHARLLTAIPSAAGRAGTLREIARRYGNRHAARAVGGVRPLSRRVVTDEELKKPPWTLPTPGPGLNLIPDASDLPAPKPPSAFVHHETGLPFAWTIVDKPDLDTVDVWLGYFDFGVAGKKEEPGDPAGLCSFNGDDVVYDVAVDEFMREATRAGLSFDPDKVHERTGTILWLKRNPVASPYAKKPEANSPVQVTIGIQANLTRHEMLATKVKTTDPVTYQVTGQVAVQLHREGKMGVELSVQGSVSFTLAQGAPTLSNLTTDGVHATLTNGQLAGQAAWVVPFLEGALQIQTFVQAVAGVNWVQEAGRASTAVTMRPYSMAQAVGGMQAVYTIPNTDKHLQIFIQAQKSLTGTDTGNTQDIQGAVGMQWNF